SSFMRCLTSGFSGYCGCAISPIWVADVFKKRKRHMKPRHIYMPLIAGVLTPPAVRFVLGTFDTRRPPSPPFYYFVRGELFIGARLLDQVRPLSRFVLAGRRNQFNREGKASSIARLTRVLPREGFWRARGKFAPNAEPMLNDCRAVDRVQYYC